MFRPFFYFVVATLPSLTHAAAPPAEIRAALASHDRAIHVKDGWIRDPYIVKGSDGWFYLTGTTQMPSQAETAEAKFNTGLGNSTKPSNT